MVHSHARARDFPHGRKVEAIYMYIAEQAPGRAHFRHKTRDRLNFLVQPLPSLFRQPAVLPIPLLLGPWDGPSHRESLESLYLSCPRAVVHALADGGHAALVQSNSRRWTMVVLIRWFVRQRRVRSAGRTGISLSLPTKGVESNISSNMLGTVYLTGSKDNGTPIRLSCILRDLMQATPPAWESRSRGMPSKNNTF